MNAAICRPLGLHGLVAQMETGAVRTPSDVQAYFKTFSAKYNPIQKKHRIFAPVFTNIA
jgi:hypothetical protein